MTATFERFVDQRFGGKLTHGKHDPNGAACLHEALNVMAGYEWVADPTDEEWGGSFVRRADALPDAELWSDDTTGTLDLRGLNDAPWSSDEARTAAMLPLGAIVLGWPSWTPEKRQAWAKAVAKGVIQRILPPTLRALAERVPSVAPDLVAAALRCETTPDESAAWSAWSAARSAAWSAAESAAESAWSAESAEWSLESAARSARSAARSAAASAAARSAAASAAVRSARSAAASAASDVPLQELCRIMVEAEEATR